VRLFRGRARLRGPNPSLRTLTTTGPVHLPSVRQAQPFGSHRSGPTCLRLHTHERDAFGHPLAQIVTPTLFRLSVSDEEGKPPIPTRLSRRCALHNWGATVATGACRDTRQPAVSWQARPLGGAGRRCWGGWGRHEKGQRDSPPCSASLAPMSREDLPPYWSDAIPLH
jgi:hypothetical protein